MKCCHRAAWYRHYASHLSLPEIKSLLLHNTLPSPGNLDSLNPKHAFHHPQHLSPTPCRQFRGKREAAPARSCLLQVKHGAGFNYRAKLSDNMSPNVITWTAQKEVEELAFPARWRPCCHHSLLCLRSWGLPEGIDGALKNHPHRKRFCQQGP